MNQESGQCACGAGVTHGLLVDCFLFWIGQARLTGAVWMPRVDCPRRVEESCPVETGRFVPPDG